MFALLDNMSLVVGVLTLGCLAVLAQMSVLQVNMWKGAEVRPLALVHHAHLFARAVTTPWGAAEL
jgi:hypothetical protein